MVEIKTLKRKTTNKFSSVSHNFKIAMVMLIFFLALFRLIDIYYFPAFDPAIDILSDEILIIVVLFIIIYLWIQEVRDYHKLLKLNRDLIFANEQLKQGEIDSIASLIKAEEAKDPYTYGHSERVTKISLAIADAMGLDDETRGSILRAGVLHDIGKIGIKDAVLLKKEKLTDEEWEIIKSHSQKGADILRPLRFLANEIDIIVHHHERYDGKGYPDGLKGKEIPLGALILAVADAFDAMNSERPYRKPLSQDEIMSELKKSSGGQHSPEIVDVFIGLLKKNPQLWAR